MQIKRLTIETIKAEADIYSITIEVAGTLEQCEDLVSHIRYRIRDEEKEGIESNILFLFF